MISLKSDTKKGQYHTTMNIKPRPHTDFDAMLHEMRTIVTSSQLIFCHNQSGQFQPSDTSQIHLDLLNNTYFNSTMITEFMESICTICIC